MFLIFSDQSDDLGGPVATAAYLDQAFAWITLPVRICPPLRALPQTHGSST